MRQHHIPIAFIQETKAPNQAFVQSLMDPDFTAYECPNPVTSSHGGVAIIVHTDISQHVHNLCTDHNLQWHSTLTDRQKDALPHNQSAGRWMTIQIDLFNTTFTLVNHYAPSASPQARSVYYRSIATMWQNTPNLIMAGDWNCVLDMYKDQITANNNPHHDVSADDLQTLVDNHGLNDSYMATADMNDCQKPVYMTNYARQGTARRIDRFYHSHDIDTITHNLIDIIDYEQGPAPNISMPDITTTHRPVGIFIINQNNPRIKQHKDQWVINMDLARQDVHQQAIIKIIRQYHITATRSPKIGKNWDKMKTAIRRYMRSVQTRNAKRVRTAERRDAAVLTDVDSTTQQKQEARDRIHDRTLTSHDAARIRFRGQAIEEQDRMTRFHFAHNAARHASSVMHAAQGPNGAPVTAQRAIEDSFDTYWGSVFAERKVDDNDRDEILNTLQRALRPQQADTLAKHLTRDEIGVATGKMKLGKSPGGDGLPLEFYLHFGYQIHDSPLIDFLHMVLLEAYDQRLLPQSMRQIQLRLIFKKNTDAERLLPKNYRPIALLNTDYKIMSKILSMRLAPMMEVLLDASQAGAPGRHIYEPILTVRSIIEHTKRYNQEAAILFLDFEKAFDSVDHQYIFSTMRAMNIPEEFIRWSSLAFTDTYGRCIVNGKLSSGFTLPGGGRQGDSLFPLIFSLVMQGLKTSIDSARDSQGSTIQGIDVPFSTKRIRIPQYVDDSAICITRMQDFQVAFDAIQKFGRASGMRINWDKTVGMWIGDWMKRPPHSQLQVSPTHTIKFIDHHGQYITKLRYLGITCGHVAPAEGWHAARDTILATTTARISPGETDRGRVLIGNAVFIGKINFSVAAEVIPQADRTEMAKLLRFAVSGKRQTILNHKVLLSGPAEGNPIRLVDVKRHVTTLHAKPVVRIATHDYPNDYEHFWTLDMHVLARKANLVTVDQLLASKVPVPAVVTVADPLVAQAVTAFRDMKFGAPKPLIAHYNDAAAVLLFHNPDVVKPATNAERARPWNADDRITLAFSKPRGNRLYYAGQLYTNFNPRTYRTTPWVRPGTRLTVEQFNDTFGGYEVEYQFTMQEYEGLTASLDTAYPDIDTWLSQGSSTLQRGVYHTIPTQYPTTTVYMAASGQAGHVYELTLHNEHGLTHIVSDNERLLQLAAPDPHHPGVTNPGVVDLKPIKHRTFALPKQTQGQRSATQITQYCIPFPQHVHPTGVLFPSDKYDYLPQPGAKYRDAAKHYRRDTSYHNYATHALRLQLAADPIVAAADSVDSSAPDFNPIHCITTAMQSMMVPPRTWQPIFRLLHDSLFVGLRAVHHQRQVCHMHHYAPEKIYPNHCILHTCQGAQCTQQHELFDCPAVQPLWTVTRRLVTELGDTDPVPTTIYACFQHLVIHGNTAKSPDGPIAVKVLTTNLIALTIKAITSANHAKMQARQDQAHNPDPASLYTEHLRRIRHEYTTLLRAEIRQLPHHVDTLYRRQRFAKQVTRDPPRKFTERELQLMPRPTYAIRNINPVTERLFLETWCKTHIVDVSNPPSGRTISIRNPFS